jgi:small-conductance mechanosensitive channel
VTTFTDAFPWWVIAAAIGLPLAMIVLTELITWLQVRGNPAANPLRMLRNWVLPVAALLVLLAFAIQAPTDRVWVRVVATVLGLLLILLILSSFNVALFSNARAGSWRERTPKIFIEIARLILVIVGLAILFSWVWGTDVGGLVAALGVTSIVIGLALQNAVGGVISGLLLLFEQPFKIGDWLQTSSATGRVIEVNWRAVHIDTGSGIQIIPNSSLATASFTNLSQSPGAYHAQVDVTFTTDDPPHDVAQLLTDVAHALPNRSRTEAPVVVDKGAGAYAITVALIGPAVAEEEISRYRSWLWYAARRRGLALDGDNTDPLADPARLAAAIESLAPALQLNDESRRLLNSTARLERYGPGEVILPTGIVPGHIRFLVSGRALLTVEAAGGRIQYGRAERGDSMGETALTRQTTLSSAVAADLVTVLRVPVDTIDALVRTRPTLAAEIGRTIELRRRAVSDALATAGVAKGLLAVR